MKSKRRSASRGGALILAADGKVTVSVGVGTTKTYDAVENQPSYVVDGHTMTLAPNRKNLFAVVEDTVDPWLVEDPSEGELENAPTDPPVETPFEALLGVTVPEGPSRQVAHSTDAKFSLPVSRYKDDPAGMHFVADDKGKQPAPVVKKMVDYAKLWAGPKKQPQDPHAPDVLNPEYPDFGANCANFASQVLEKGGWKQKKDGWFGTWDSENWGPELNKKKDKDKDDPKPSYTWSLARDLYTYVKNNSTYDPLTGKQGHEAAMPGDLIFVDWDNSEKDGMGHPDGTIDHVMVVTGTASPKEDKRFNTRLFPGTIELIPTISQKSPNRNNQPITETYRTLQTDFRADAKQMKWFALVR